MAEKKQYEVIFLGKTKGAIGISYRIIATVEAEDEDGARLALYERYDHVQRPVFREVTKGAK